ncbi:unnamed protein product [Effrenium voratum]|nr:unnamed protein product [Effrenium voratum]
MPSHWVWRNWLQQVRLCQVDCVSRGGRGAHAGSAQRVGLSQDLAKEFYKSFGGNIFLCHQAIDKLRQQFRMGEENLFHPFNVRGGNAWLGGLVGDPLTRKHMVNLAEKGWSAIEDGTATEETESQRGARVIAKRNFGAIIEREAPTFLDPALKAAMFRDRRVLLSPTTYARKCIQRVVETMKSSRPQQAGAVWVRQLQQDGKDFEIVGNAFQVKGVLTNVDDLKKAIKAEEELSIAASKIDVYSQKDGRWVREDEEAAVKCDRSKADCYGFMLPAGAAGAA